jgi:hypothetical protein
VRTRALAAGEAGSKRLRAETRCQSRADVYFIGRFPTKEDEMVTLTPDIAEWRWQEAQALDGIIDNMR